MNPRHRITSTPDTRGTPINRSDALNHSASSAFSTILSTSDCEWKPFDLVQKRSGPHNLSRSGYDEEKCRNVLVRFCAHVPRNFQYKDGIQQIFLILREHLGDENLDLAGGVLYEFIEVDCEHTDDPGAAFQRWRHDHMYRYADLELPHIPHMTTITSSIVPTDKLLRWRLEHADRYRFVLSDSCPLANRDYVDPSCVRHKKAWLIDHTLFVSTRSDGTRPMRSPNPKQFHEMQWDTDYGATGKLVEERELPINSLERPSETSPPETTDIFVGSASRSQRLRHSLSNISIIGNFVEKLGKQKKEPEVEQRRRSWMPNSFPFNSSSLFKDKQAHCGIMSVPFPEGCQIPHAIFARKFLIVDNGETLPSNLPISQMPTAEFKATETIVEAANVGLLNQTSSWLFRGPFTPQLGFDGGLDYQWNPQDPSITVRRFDLEGPAPENPNFDLDHFSRAAKLPAHSGYVKSQQLSKRRGRVFAYERETEGTACASTRDSHHKISLSRSSNDMAAQYLPISSPYTADMPTRLGYETPGISRKLPLARHEELSRDAQLFNNVEFTIQAGEYNACTPLTNRQTTIVERPGEFATVNDCTTCRPEHAQRALNSVNNCMTSLVDSNTNNDNESPRELVLSNLQQEAYGFRTDIPNSRRVSHRVTGEILQPLRYNASGGWKRGKEVNECMGDTISY